jgi:hypothetical protein
MLMLARCDIIRGMAAASHPRRLVVVFLWLAVLALGATPQGSHAVFSSQVSSAALASIDREAVLRVMTAAADWQLANPSSHAPYDWTQAAFYTGVIALAEVSNDARYFDAMRTMGENNAWRPGLRTRTSACSRLRSRCSTSSCRARTTSR